MGHLPVRLPSMNQPRQYTEDEIRDQFLDQCRAYVTYWHDLPGKTKREAMEGLVFSLLVILDGETGLPGFVVAPAPHESDEAYHKQEGTNWYPAAPTGGVDIAGCLHELFYPRQ
jgi:hypothetical protein